MIFAEALEDTIKSEKTLTENGAVGYKTSKSSLVDFNFKASSFRNQSEQEIENAFADAYNENPLMAVKLLFMTGDIRQGMGERRTFTVCLKWLAKHHKEIAEKDSWTIDDIKNRTTALVNKLMELYRFPG